MIPDLSHGLGTTSNANAPINIGEVISNRKDKTTFVESNMLETFNVRVAKFVLSFKLSRDSLNDHHQRFYNATETEASQALLETVNKLLDTNLSNFEKLVREMDYNELSIGDAFSTVALDVLHGDEKDITWMRIAILFAFAVIMAKPVLPSSSSREFLNNFGIIIGEVIDFYAGSWIERQGGWKNIKSSNVKSIPNILMGMLGVGTTVLGAAVTIFSYSHAASAFTTFLRK